MRFLERAIHVTLVLAMLFVLALVSSPVWAQTSHGFELSWTDPTEREDETPFDANTETGQYRAECTRTGNGWDAAAFVVFTRDQTSPTSIGRGYTWVDAVSQGGWYDCRMNIADVNGLVSNWSGVVTVRRLAKPKPPEMR